jgi:hypothetical protein
MLPAMKNQSHLRFSKENMWTVGSFVLDSFENHQATFVELFGDKTFGADFLAAYMAALAKIKGATGGAVRVGGGTLVTTRLYDNLEQLKPLLNRLDARLGLLSSAALTAPAKNFGLKTLRAGINSRNAEGVSRGLVQLLALVDSNRPLLDGKGYTDAERTALVALQSAIDADNKLQNSGANTNQEATKVEGADYAVLDALLGQVLRTGRLIFKSDSVKRKQYELRALNKRVIAGERPKQRV